MLSSLRGRMSQSHAHFNIRSDIPGYVSELFTFDLIPLSRLDL